jgi:D-xylulose reductase
VHGVLRPSVVHPAAFTYKLPDNVSFAEGAMVEPLAVGMQAAKQAGHQAGDLAVVIGAGPIGMVTVLAALASGCSRVVVSDPQTPKLERAAKLGPVTTVNPRQRSVRDLVAELTDGWGADVVYECSGHPKVAGELFEPLRPGGCVVYVGMPVEPIAFDIVDAQVKQARIETVFRYANVFDRALELMGSGKIDVTPLITDRFDFEESVKAFDFAADMPADSVKAQIIVDEAE